MNTNWLKYELEIRSIGKKKNIFWLKKRFSKRKREQQLPDRFRFLQQWANVKRRKSGDENAKKKSNVSRYCRCVKSLWCTRKKMHRFLWVCWRRINWIHLPIWAIKLYICVFLWTIKLTVNTIKTKHSYCIFITRFDDRVRT